MARQSRTPTHIVELTERLRQEPYSFDFYQAVRLLDCANQGTPATGQSETTRDDPFRFSQEATMIFSPATLSDLEEATTHHPPRLVQRFFGLFGPQGPLPVHLTDYARSRIRHYNDPTFHRFLDMFHHRMLSFFYRAWARVRPTVNLDRGVRDRFGDYVAAFFGLGMDALNHRDALPDLAKRHYSGLFSCQTKHAEGLLSILQGYFGLPVDLEQFIGQWIPLPEECICRMGESPAVSTLGESITVGSHIWDCQQKFRVQFGPLDLENYFHLLPVTMRFLEAMQEPESAGDRNQATDTASADDGETSATDTESTAPDDQAKSKDVADTLYFNAQFFTGDEARPWVEAIAVRHGETLAAGSLDALQPFLDDNTCVADLKGSLVIPDISLELDGRGDQPESTAVRWQCKSTSEGDGACLLEQQIRETVASSPVGTWIDVTLPPSEVFGTFEIEKLDQLAPDHPLAIRFEDDDSKVALNSLARGAFENLPGRPQIDREFPQRETDGPTVANESTLQEASRPETTHAFASAASVFDGSSAKDVLAALDAGSYPLVRVPQTECDRAPHPYNHWHVLQARLRKLLREHNKSGDKASLLERASRWEGERPTTSDAERLRRYALIRAMQGQAPAHAPAGGDQWGLRAQRPANMLVLSQDLFAVAEDDAIDRIPDTRLVKAIRRGTVVYDLLGEQQTSSDAPTTFANVKHQWAAEFGWETDDPSERSGDEGTSASSEAKSGHRDESKSLESLIALVRTYVGDQLQWDVQLILKAQETPPLGLGLQGHLGWSTWLLRDHIDRDPDDLILDAMAARSSAGESYEYHKVDQWDHRVLGQTVGGGLMLAQHEQQDTAEVLVTHAVPAGE